MKTYPFLYSILAAIAIPVTILAQAPDLTGTWIAESNASQNLILEQKDGKIHVQEMNGGKVDLDFTCSTSGQECEAKENGHSEKITMYFNGAKLVELRERGNDTIKQRLALSNYGKVLTVETVPLSSQEQIRIESFRRQPSQT